MCELRIRAISASARPALNRERPAACFKTRRQGSMYLIGGSFSHPKSPPFKVSSFSGQQLPGVAFEQCTSVYGGVARRERRFCKHRGDRDGMRAGSTAAVSMPSSSTSESTTAILSSGDCTISGCSCPLDVFSDRPGASVDFSMAGEVVTLKLRSTTWVVVWIYCRALLLIIEHLASCSSFTKLCSCPGSIPQ